MSVPSALRAPAPVNQGVRSVAPPPQAVVLSEIKTHQITTSSRHISNQSEIMEVPAVIKTLATLIVAIHLSGCSTTGGIYSPSDPDNSEFSIGRTLLSIVAVAGAVAVAANGGGGGGASSYAAQDYDWAWDEFYNQHYQLVWACRGKQTGQFADLEKCAYKYKSDITWPAKSIN